MGTAPTFADGLHVNPTTQQMPSGGVIHVHHHVHVHIPVRVVQPIAVVSPVVVAPVRVVQPVAVVPVPVVTATTVVVSTPSVVVSAPYPWSSYGPNWNAGWTLAQQQQLCQSYVQTLAMNPAAFNQYVQAVCDGSGSTPY
jgi:hypothetical protein